MTQEMKETSSSTQAGNAVMRTATILAMSAALAGCSGMDLGRIGNVSGDKAANKSSEKAAKAMAKGDHSKALMLAEASVAASPNNAQYRLTLAQAYMAAGRFASAETSFADALALGNADGRAAIGLALSMLANGKQSEALEVLGTHRDSMTAADYGLALALAGDAATAIEVLDAVVRQPDATPRMRQNLAFSYAVAGRWLEAKIIAAQDMNPANLESRMANWSALISSSTPTQRVAGLLGVTPAASDAGQPARLALNPVAAEAVQMAEAAGANDDLAAAPAVPVTQLVEAAPAADMVAAPMVSSPAAVPAFTPEAAVPASPDAPLIQADGIAYKSEPVVQPMRMAMPTMKAKAPTLAVSQPKPAKAVAPKAPAVKAAPAKMASVAAAGSSNWVVQLGAYDSLGVAQNKWGALSRQFPGLSGFVGKGTNATVNGKNFVRLSASGFASQKDAMALCASVKAKGGTCLVRQMAKGETVRWASSGAPAVKMAAAKPAKTAVRVASR